MFEERAEDAEKKGQDAEKGRSAFGLNLLFLLLLLGMGIGGMFYDWRLGGLFLGLALLQVCFCGVLGRRRIDTKLPFRLDL